jgi:anti-sigma B factor antagonist
MEAVVRSHPDQDIDPSPHDFRTRVIDGRPRPTVVVEGEIDLQTAPQFEAALAQAMDLGKRIQVDLSGTDFMDSAGVSALLAAYRRLGQVPEAIVLIEPSPSVRRVLTLAGIASLFTLFPA